MENSYLFVYGTLKKGYYNNSLISHTEFIGSAISVDRFNVSGYSFPCAHPNEDGKLLMGEIYNMSESDFIFTDRLEGNGSLYNREVRKFVCDGKIIKAWIYIIINEDSTPYDTDSDIINWDYSYSKRNLYY